MAALIRYAVMWKTNKIQKVAKISNSRRSAGLDPLYQIEIIAAMESDHKQAKVPQ